MLTQQQLGSYLAWAIHGRKPQRRAASSTRKGPPRDPAYLAWVREMPCIACDIEGRSEAAHTGTDGSMSQKASDYSCVPLCAVRTATGKRRAHTTAWANGLLRNGTGSRSRGW